MWQVSASDDVRKWQTLSAILVAVILAQIAVTFK
jgi:hypothetical protein